MIERRFALRRELSWHGNGRRSCFDLVWRVFGRSKEFYPILTSGCADERNKFPSLSDSDRTWLRRKIFIYWVVRKVRVDFEGKLKRKRFKFSIHLLNYLDAILFYNLSPFFRQLENSVSPETWTKQNLLNRI